MRGASVVAAAFAAFDFNSALLKTFFRKISGYGGLSVGVGVGCRPFDEWQQAIIF
jgi:hypothetical protein